MKLGANIFGTIFSLLLFIVTLYYMVQNPKSGDTWVGFIPIAISIIIFYACAYRGLIKKKD